MFPHIAQIEQLSDFDVIIDVRSPSEYAQDHIWGAINCPVLSDEQRAEVGTLHKHNVFEARRLGAAYVSQNMANLLQTTFSQHDKRWRPLVCCWRGGMRSGSAAYILAQIGWHAHQLKGGYKAYRRQVIAELEELPLAHNFIVVCGPTGTGKSRFLRVLSSLGHQVLDLEGLAKHRGSLLGLMPEEVQPSQKWFETCLAHELKQFDPALPIYIEAESKRIGQITLPDALYEKMHQGKCVQMDVPLAERIRFLCEDYHCYIEKPHVLTEKIARLIAYRSKQEVKNWLELIELGDFNALIKALLENHYDPLYQRSMSQHYVQLDQAQVLSIKSLEYDSLLEAAQLHFLTLRAQ